MKAWRGALLAAAVALDAEAGIGSAADAISIGEIEKTLHAIDHDRTSGRDGELQAAAYLERKLDEYGVPHRRHAVRAYLSWPVSAELALAGQPGTIAAVTPSFAASTPPEGLTAEVVFLTAGPEDDLSPIRQDVRGKIAVASGLISPESVWRAQQAGAAGLVHVNLTDVLHEMTATTVWGTPTPESAARIPRIPVLSISKADGERLRAAATRGVKARLRTRVERGWREIPLVVAEVPGLTADFVLVATHLDAWYSGMTDTAGTVASILEMARVLAGRRLERGVRFAWWPGHSFGRYPGSTWYADRFWSELDRHCVAYTNLDGSGRRGSLTDAVEAGGWPGLREWSREFAATLTGKTPEGAAEVHLFRPGRDSDSAFQGLGIPEFQIGVPGPPDGHPDVEPSGLIRYWHTAQDTLDKLDFAALELDTKYRVAQIEALAGHPLLPHRLAPIAAAFREALEPLAREAGGRVDLAGALEQVARLSGLAVRFDEAPAPPDSAGLARRNRLLVAATHRLNAALYARSGRFEQDWAAALPVLPLVAGVRELAAIPRDSDAAGFQETGLVRGRNQLEAALTQAADDLEAYFR